MDGWPALNSALYADDRPLLLVGALRLNSDAAALQLVDDSASIDVLVPECPARFESQSTAPYTLYTASLQPTSLPAESSPA